jgi:hypothetical protein
VGHVAYIGDTIGAYRVLVGRPDGKRPIRGPRHRLENNIKINLQYVGLGEMEWIALTQDRDR